MKVLFFNPEQYVDFENEPSNYQIRLPFLKSCAITQHRDFVYQRVLRADGVDAMNAAALAEVAAFKPDLVVNSLSWWNESIDAATLHAIRAQGIEVLSVFWDTWINPLPHEVEIFLASDLVLIMDSLAGYLKYRLLREQSGAGAHVVFCPIAVFTDTVRPMPADKDIDVLMLGSNEGQRAELATMLNQELSKRGIGFQRLGGLVDDANSGSKAKAWIDWPTYAQTISRAKICVSSQTQPDRMQIKGKIFDFLACGSFCLTDANPELARFLPAGTHATYRDATDCVTQIERYLRDDAARDGIAQAGHAWMNATYDYKAFWRAVADGMTHGADRLPVLPGVEEAYRQMYASQSLVARTQLAALGQLANLVLHVDRPKRLAVQAQGSYQGINILKIDDRFVVATNSLDIDFLEIGGELHALTPDGGLTPLKLGEPLAGRPTQMIRAGSVDAAKRIIDSLFA